MGEQLITAFVLIRGVRVESRLPHVRPSKIALTEYKWVRAIKYYGRPATCPAPSRFGAFGAVQRDVGLEESAEIYVRARRQRA